MPSVTITINVARGTTHVAMDADGTWRRYTAQPEMDRRGKWHGPGRRYLFCTVPGDVFWRQTLTEVEEKAECRS